MSIQLGNEFSFPMELVNKAVAFPTGRYVEVDDGAFEQNGLGRKIVQTQLVNVGGREVSVGYVNADGTGYELILADEKPRDLDSFDAIIRGNTALYGAFEAVFGNSATSYSHQEMVMAITKARDEGVGADDGEGIRRVATWVRTTAKRASWVAKNRMEAMINAPLDWKAIGL